MQKMKLILGIMLCVTLSVTGAETDSSASSTQALVFEVDNLFHLSGFRAGTLCYRKSIDLATEYRYELSINMDYSLPVYESVKEGTGSASHYNSHFGDMELRHQTYVSVGRTKIHHSPPKNDIAFFKGFGPKVGVSLNGRKLLDDLQYPDSEESYVSGSVFMGFTGLAGVEWALNEKFSLHAEYGTTGQFRVSFNRARSQSNYTSTDIITETNLYMEPGFEVDSYTLVGLSVWF